jgi:UDP-glucose 4-epimerase
MALFLVTGVAGFIGSSIARALVARGDAVRGIDNFSTGKPANLVGLEKIEFIEADLNTPGIAERGSQGVSCIFHQAAIPSVPRSIEDPLGSNKANVDATVVLLEAARKAGVKRIVYAGSSSVYGNRPSLPKREDMLPAPLSPYAVSKVAGEYYLQAFHECYGLETVTLRYFNVFGPHQDPTSQYSGVLAVFISRMLKQQPVTIHGDGEQSRDFTFIENVVAGNLLAAGAHASRVAGRVFNVATGTRVTLNETVKILGELTGYTGKVVYDKDRPGDVKHSLADITAARAQLAYEPQVSFRDGLKKTVEWYRSEAALVGAETRS